MNDLLAFLSMCPSRFHAVSHLGGKLEEAGYTRLSEGSSWSLASGGKYYVTRNGSALLAFRIPRADFSGFMISASHSDSPSFHVKENAELSSAGGYVRINTEGYGGMLCAPWFDRPLTVAGRVLVQTADAIETRLVYVDKNLLMIPSLARHLNKAANEGFKYDMKCDMIPLMGLNAEEGTFRSVVAGAAGCAAEDILGTDLYLCLREKGFIWGANSEFISAPALDDLQCAYGCFQGFMAAEDSASVPVFALLDNEEIGSCTKQGADGNFLDEVVTRICACMGRERASAVANSFMVSADNAQGIHPNHPELYDPTHHAVMNGGIVIKHGVRYATDGAAQAVFMALCKKAGIPVQHFSNRSDLPGGGTLGLISTSHISMNTVDIGLAQLAMHSCLETAGVQDTGYLIQAMTAFYSASFREDNGRFTLD